METLRTIRLTSLSMFLIVVNVTYCQLAPWRPRLVPDDVLIKDVNSVRQSIQTFSYTAADGDTLISLSLLFPADEATRILKQYLSAYSMKTSNKDLQWARAVFCLGLVHTKEAKEYLLMLWRDCDQDLASGKVKVPISGGEGDYDNFLAPIADSLRFYLDDPNMQSWVYQRAGEIMDIPQSTPVRDLNASCRRAGRSKLVLALYTWLIVDSASENRNLHRLITEDYFFSLPQDIDYAKSAASVVNIASRLKDWYPDMSEREWMKMRRQYTDSCLDDVVRRLGTPLASAIWEQYLGSHIGVSKVSKGSELRLWWITLQSYGNAISKKKGELSIDAKEDMFLNEACVYFERLPKGFWTDVCIEGLYAIACYFPDSNESPSIQTIRDLANRRLSEQARQSVLLRVQRR